MTSLLLLAGGNGRGWQRTLASAAASTLLAPPLPVAAWPSQHAALACLYAHQLQARRAGSSGRRGRGWRTLSGYEEMLNAWRAQARPPRGSSGSNSRGASADGPRFGAKEHQQPGTSARCRTRNKKGTQHQHASSWADWGRWHDSDLAAAAAAGQLHPAELHNLFFGSSSSTAESSSSRRRMRRKQAQARRRSARLARARQAGLAAGYAEWGEDDWSGDSADSSDDEAACWGRSGRSSSSSYSSYSNHGQHARTGWERPDWQWWSDEQEREWFRQAWQQQEGGRRGQQSGSSGGSGQRPWWESFQRAQQQQQQQQQQRQQQQQQGQWQQWQHAHANYGEQHARQQAHIARHPPSVLANLAVLGLQVDAALPSRAQLKAAFHQAALRWHPDRHADAGAKAAAEAKFKVVKEAFESLVLQARA